MSIRIRKNGELVCGAKSKARKGDTYIPDGLHYNLSVIQKVLIPDIDEEKTGRWHWLHSECNVSNHKEEDDFVKGCFPLAG
jgi:hypothetical protein